MVGRALCRAACLGLWAALAHVPAATAQEEPGRRSSQPVQSLILTIESDRLFVDSAYGERIAREIEAEGQRLAAENRRIEADLSEEEEGLTERRDTLPAAEFRELADAFDEKVQRIRREQDAKARELNQRGDEARRAFFGQVQPVLEQIMVAAGAAVIVERRTVVMSADVIDVTEEALERIDAAIGDGRDAPEDAPAPKDVPTPPEDLEPPFEE
ncbi:MAG: OmpH family outer membrane protein [Paracoccaceae bacterium]